MFEEKSSRLQGFRGAGGEVRPIRSSFRPDAYELDHLGPLLRVVGNQLSEIGRGAHNDRTA